MRDNISSQVPALSDANSSNTKRLLCHYHICIPQIFSMFLNQLSSSCTDVAPSSEESSYEYLRNTQPPSVLFQMHLSSVQVVCVALVTLALGAAAAPPAGTTHHVARRSFFNLQCKGVYDSAIFARLDRICDDCYNLFREPQLYTLCRCVFFKFLNVIHRPEEWTNGCR